MRPDEVLISVASDPKRVILRSCDYRNCGRSAKRIPDLDVSVLFQHFCVGEDGSDYGFSDWRPAYLFLPAVLVHLLLVEFEKESALVLAHVESQVGVERQL